MKETMKFIVTEVNKLLNRNYNVIYFNSLAPEELLQVLKDTLIKIQDESCAVDETRNETPEEAAVHILSVLRVLHYQPQTDPASFRQGLIQGDSDTIHPILNWLLSNIENVRKRSYLSRFLVKFEVPDDYLNDPEVSSLYEQYTTLIDKFKAVHKERDIGKKHAKDANELSADLKTMEKEKEAVIMRIEKMRSKAEAGLYLLDVAKNLRIEKEKERDLMLQEEQEREIMSRLQTSLQRLERELEILKKDEGHVTVQTLLQHLSEVTTVQGIVVNENLPAEIIAKETRIKALQSVKQYSDLGPDQITILRNKLDDIAKEIQSLVELKISKTNINKIEPFRQQSAAVTNIKRNVLDKLEKAESTLRELERKLEEKDEISKLVIEDIIPKGEEFKKYINRLKTRGTLYQHCKSELTWLNAENSVLHRTAVILENQYKERNQAQERLKIAQKNIPNNFTQENASTINQQLYQSISAFKAKLIPLVNEVEKLRVKYQELEQNEEEAKKAQNEVESSIPINDLQIDVDEKKVKISELTEENAKLQKLINKMQNLEKRIQSEAENSTGFDPSEKIKEELRTAIQMEEAKIKSLMKEKEYLRETIGNKEKQTQMWKDILSVFNYKIKCAEENKRLNGVLVRQGGAETLVLQ